VIECESEIVQRARLPAWATCVVKGRAHAARCIGLLSPTLESGGKFR
jgi:hypothetical protein